MDLLKAIKLLEQEYERAQKMCFVRNPLAWALYRVWKKADGQKDWDEDCIRDCKNCWKTKLAKPQWIPVSERLPDFKGGDWSPSRLVSVLMYDGTVSVGYCNKGMELWMHLPSLGSKFVAHDFRKTPVVAWMPLPEPPKEGF